jgi:hypothetical protein
MDISNLAAVFCPGILRHPDHNTPIQYKISQCVIEFLIEFQSLFTMQLLAPSKPKQSSIASNDGKVPPVPLLLPSSYPKLHVVNPSAPSIVSSPNGSFIESPSDITPQPKQRSISLHRGISSPSTTTINQQESFMHRISKVTAPYYHRSLQTIQTIQPWLGTYTILNFISILRMINLFFFL